MEIIPETIKNYKKIIKHLKSHIAEGNYDDLDIEQLMMLENEIDVLEKTKSIYSGERILAVKEEIEAAGIQKPEPPTPLEIVSENQVKLVTWMAVKGSISTTV